MSEIQTDHRIEEEIESTATYPREYRGPRPIEEQIKKVSEIFDLDPSKALRYARKLPKLPIHAEGWFAFPSNEALRKMFPRITDRAVGYCAGVQFVRSQINASRGIYDWHDSWHEEDMGPDRLRVHARTKAALDLITYDQPGDILIVAAQLGFRHRGRSANRARQCFTGTEFGLGAFAVGVIALTHPSRLVSGNELDMGCPGDDLGDPLFGSFDLAPMYYFGSNRVKLCSNWSNLAVEADYGWVTAFPPVP